MKYDLQQQVVNKINANHALLGLAAATYEVGGVLFQVYCAKPLHSSRWKSVALKKLVTHARSSYLRYGLVNPHDTYDQKSAIYLTRVSYVHTCKTRLSHTVEEWLSMRFVPSDGLPEYTEDLLFSMCEGKSLVEWLRIKNLDNDKNIAEKIITLSRICGIPSDMCSNNQKTDSGGSLPSKLQYTGISFALMNKLFLEQCKLTAQPYQYITGLFREELVENALTIQINNQKRIPTFTYGYKLLGFKNPSAITLNRSLPSAPVYEFPAYFLKKDQLYHELKGLWKNGRITLRTLMHYVHIDMRADEWMKDVCSFQYALPQLGRLLTVKGILYDSSMTGEQLRSFLDTRLDDGPQLRMMRMDEWQQSIDKYLHVRYLI